MDDITSGWRDIFVASLGGGAIHAITDSFLSKFLSGGTQIAGLELKDIALIFLGKYLSERTHGDLSNAFLGMSIIALYKTVYPRFVQPLLSGMTTTTTTTTTAATVPTGGGTGVRFLGPPRSILTGGVVTPSEAAKVYISRKFPSLPGVRR